MLLAFFLADDAVNIPKKWSKRQNNNNIIIERWSNKLIFSFSRKIQNFGTKVYWINYSFLFCFSNSSIHLLNMRFTSEESLYCATKQQTQTSPYLSKIINKNNIWNRTAWTLYFRYIETTIHLFKLTLKTWRHSY